MNRTLPFVLVFFAGILHARSDAPPAIRLENFPRISSSTSYQPIVLHLVQKMLGLPVVETRPHFETGERFMAPAQPDDPRWSVGDAREMSLVERVKHHQTHGAGRKVIDGSVDMAIIPAPGPEILREAEEAGVELVATPIATEALVFLVSMQNPARGVHPEHLRNLYAGRGMSWKDLDPNGLDQPVLPLVRNLTSGSHVLFRDLLMGETPVAGNLREHEVIMMMGGLLDSVADNPTALGYSIFTYHQGMARVEVPEGNAPHGKRFFGRRPTRLLAIDGVEPTLQTLSDGTYPLLADIVLLTRADLPADHPAKLLRDWLVGEAGQAWVREIGFPPARAK